MPRQSMKDLLAETGSGPEAPAVLPVPPPSGEAGPRELAAKDEAPGRRQAPGPAAAKAPEGRPARRRKSVTPVIPDSGGPKWQRLERKELRLRADQFEQLTSLRRQLNRRRGEGRGERITENTLIRVAVDMLLEVADRLAGTTEDELRQSVSPVVNR